MFIEKPKFSQAEIIKNLKWLDAMKKELSSIPSFKDCITILECDMKLTLKKIKEGKYEAKPINKSF